MTRSLSALMPVRNTQSSLQATVLEYLEVLPELTRDFEVVIADDGSVDETIEVADELATRFPQVRVVRHATPLGRLSAIESALGASIGEVILLKDEDCRLPINEVHKLWQAMDEHDVAVAHVATAPESRWPGWQAVAGTTVGFQMIRRRVVEPILQSLHDQGTLLAALRERGDSWYEMEIGDYSPPGKTSRAAVLARHLLTRTLGQPRHTRPDPASGSSTAPKRPNYLTKIKDFALGE